MAELFDINPRIEITTIGAYFPRAHHQHFKLPTNSRFEHWHPPGPPREGNHTYVISGLVAFVKRICAYANVDHSKVIACFKQNSEQGGKIGRYQWDESQNVQNPWPIPSDHDGHTVWRWHKHKVSPQIWGCFGLSTPPKSSPRYSAFSAALFRWRC